ncbi:MAG: chemotaxis protein CheW [Mariprofundaceae bacterium]|nr:chemotaxis protein CheW [Mariprofundaceae bacterium]
MQGNKQKGELKNSGQKVQGEASSSLDNKAYVPVADIPYVDLMQLSLADEMVLIPVTEVSEVLRPQPLNKVPMAPDHLLGVCNVHGQVLCVIDPYRVMRLEGTVLEDSESTRFVSLRHPAMNLALRVDAVSSLFNIQESRLNELDEDEGLFFRGKIAIEGHVYRVVDVEALFA